ncbi:MAG TPA: glycosyltransferase [Candidatus Krumholzibacteria bacterium]|nr:glycosyltransferase [Candidatus Krumholzibacteria bacterium]HPD71770.1 glycosyltransferase [Candidatus Krumholzibacteria bacterium]HRY41297.1 glycosyltransferase [Candidatus Krumholzibacteria bacterium]
MRILHVGKYYAPVKGGMETALRHIAEGLLDLGVEVRVIVAGQAGRSTREDLGAAPGALVRAGVWGTWHSQPLVARLPSLLAAELRTFRPDIVHLHLPNPLACWAWRRAAPVAAHLGTRLAVWHHSDIVRQRLGGRLVAPLVGRCLGDAAGICVSSESLRESARSLARWRDRVRVIPFGIDPAPFLAATPAGDGPFLFVGRLVRYKGLDVLLEAMAGLPGARLDIAGTGPRRAELAARIEGADLRGRVRLLGEIPDSELPAMLAGGRALVLPSRDRSETFGLILLEAMAAGLPLVTSDLATGVSEVNQPGETGWVAAPGDPVDLRRALAAVLAEPGEARRRGCAGRALVLARFTRDRMARDLVGWYGELRAGRMRGTVTVNPGSSDQA